MEKSSIPTREKRDEQRRQNASLRAVYPHMGKFADNFDNALDAIDTLEQRLEVAEADTARLEKALQPFVDAWNARTVGPPATGLNAQAFNVSVKLSHFREAAALDAARKEGKS